MNVMMTMMLTMLAIVAFILFLIFILVPIFRGLGAGIVAFFQGVGWLIAHIVEFIGGMISDVVRLLGSLLALLVLALLVPLNVIIGRWSAAGHYSDAVKRETLVAFGCLYRFALRRPLKLFWLHGLVEGLEERVPAAMEAAPTSDTPSKRTGQFDGYTIVGSLPGGGSGGKLYVARPDDAKREELAGEPDYVVIKSFAITEGSSLPQIVRESRALECAKQLGHVLEHGMDEHRFHYVMPYHAGDSLSVISRQLHAQSDGSGLAHRQLREVMGYSRDLLATLSMYHAGGFWHKDVKPDNVIVHDGRAHLVDLGLITPLKSAMTLTTHGTEYFRDPEMVRQALRGVKVHQINGAKFDIYAAGAVLYFMIENTFPAHGGLSRFTHESPEALRWIVRRAMAEYNQRYDSAEMMLADLEAVANANDPFSVKPGQLPSMKAGAAEELDLEIETESPQVEQVKAAGSPVPPRIGPTAGTGAAVFGIGAGVREGPTSRAARHFGLHRGNPSPPAHDKPTEQCRPMLRVLNWFTGAYAVDDPGSASGGGGGWRKDGSPTPPLRPKQPGTFRTAREQLQSAQSRAREMRRRAAERRRAVARHHRAPGLERQPSFATVVIVMLVVTPLLIAALFALMPLSSQPSTWLTDLRSHVTKQNPDWTANNRSTVVDGGLYADGPPLLLVVDHDSPAQLRADERTASAIEAQRNAGYHVLENIGPDQDEIRSLLRARSERSTSEVTDGIEQVLADYDLYGFLHIKHVTAADDENASIAASVVRSTRTGAADRRWPMLDAPLPDTAAEPLLLINDHPTRADNRTSAFIEHITNTFKHRGWSIIIDDDLEASIRKLIPAGRGDEPLRAMDVRSERMQNLIHEHELGGLLYIYARPGDTPAHRRIALSIITNEGNRAAQHIAHDDTSGTE